MVGGAPAEIVRARFVRWGGLCGVLGPSVTFALILAAAFVSTWFRWEANALSDLGVSSVAPLFNGALLYGGILTIPFTLGLRAYLPRRALTDIAAGILTAGGLSLALVGVFTEDAPALHALFALGYFVLVPIGLLIVGAILTRSPFRTWTFAAGIAALLSILVLPIALQGGPVGFAVPEAIEAGILTAWIVAAGAILVRHG